MHSPVLPGKFRHVAVLIDPHLHVQVVIEHPVEVVLVAYGAYHHHPGSEIRINLGIELHGDLPIVDRGKKRLSFQVSRSGIIGVQRHHLARA